MYWVKYRKCCKYQLFQCCVWPVEKVEKKPPLNRGESSLGRCCCCNTSKPKNIYIYIYSKLKKLVKMINLFGKLSVFSILLWHRQTTSKNYYIQMACGYHFIWVLWQKLEQSGHYRPTFYRPNFVVPWQAIALHICRASWIHDTNTTTDSQ